VVQKAVKVKVDTDAATEVATEVGWREVLTAVGLTVAAAVVAVAVEIEGAAVMGPRTPMSPLLPEPA